MLLIVYRSILTTLLTLVAVAVEVAAARGVVAFLGHIGIIPLSTYATNLLTLLAVAAGTDYAIFLLGRYQEARQAGEDRKPAYFTMYRGTAHVIIGSGLTVAGGGLLPAVHQTPYFQSLGIPAGIGVLVTLVASLTLTPAVITIGSPSDCSTPSGRCGPVAGAASAPPSCAGPDRSWWPRSRWR